MLNKQFLYSAISLLLAASLSAGGCAEADVAVDEDTQSENNLPSNNNRPDGGGDDPDSDLPLPTPAPVATISATPTAGIAPLQVAFSAEVSAGSGVYEFAWDFGDSQTSTAKSPSHLYETPGTYEASLVVTDTTTSKTSDTQTITIRVSDFDSPLVTASASPTRGAAPLSVSFNTTTTGGSASYSYTWDFGDGSAASTAQAPSHEYTTPGTYNATVTVTDANGKTDSDQVAIEVESAEVFRVDLVASPSSGVAPLSVVFATSIQGGEAPYTYAWDFADGETSASATPSHTFDTVGTYEVALTLTSADGATAENTITVNAQAPDALTITPSASPDQGIAPLTVQFQASASGGSGTLSYQWVFGDGQTSNEKNPRHTYFSAGTFDVSVVVTDALGSTANGSLTIEAGSDQVPTASASASRQAGRAPLSTNFYGSATGGDAPLSYKWTFGDGSASVTTQDASHTYTTPGNYTATFQVTDDDGDTNSATVLITVTDKLSPKVNANANPTSGNAPLDVTFSSIATSGEAPYSYQWTFGDGSAPSSGQSPQHTYTNAGDYTATVTVTDDAGETVSDTIAISVSSNSVPAVNPSVDTETGVAPHTVQLSANATGGDAPLTFEWFFGDGSPNGSGETVSHTYSSEGYYEPEVIVTDADGDTASATVAVLVERDIPDLAVEGWRATVNGQEVTYEVDIKNRGTVDSSDEFYISIYHDRSSAPDDYSAVDELVSLPDPTIGAGQTVTGVVSFEGRPAGDYNAYIWVDYFEDLNDSDRSNNIAGPVSYTIEASDESVLINELMYDSPGGDTATFIELRGTPGMDISGYTLVHINGSNGANAGNYVFAPGTTIPADGYLVIGDGGGVANQDLEDGFANLQNGPDSLILEDAGGVEIDAVGYGNFGSGQVFAGRGDSAYAAKEGYSLGRDGSPNTDNNRTDFVNWRVPTPGAPNALALSNAADTCGDAYLFAEPENNGGVFSIRGDLAEASTNQFSALSQSGVGVCEATGDSFGGLDQVYKFSVSSATAMVQIDFVDSSGQDLDLVLTGAPCTSLDTGFEACVAGAETGGSSGELVSLSGGDYYLVVLEDATSPSGASELPYAIRVEIAY